MALLTNLDAYWKLDSNSNDSTANANNGTDTGITYNSGNGKVGQGAGFNGTTSKIVIPDSASLKPSGNFSIAGWFKKSSAPAVVASIFQSFSFNPTLKGFSFQVNAAQRLLLNTYSGSGNVADTDYKVIQGSTSLCDNAYHFCVGTYDGSNLKLYVDGASDAADVAWVKAAGYAATNYPRIGVENENGADQFFTAMAVDEIGLWSRALSAAEVTALWNAGAGFTYPFSTATSGGAFLFNFV